jgi:formimidoylglutamate deiminase
MRTLLFDTALLPDGWAAGVAVTVDATGDIVSVDRDPSGHAGERIGGIVLPGVPNLHSHAHQRAMAGLAERAGAGEDSFWTWRELMYGTLDRLQPDQLEAIAAQLYVEMLKAGYTSVAEFQYVHHDRNGRPYQDPAEMSLRTLAAAREAGIGITSLPVLYHDGGFGGQPADPAQRRFLNDADGFMAIVGRLRTASAGDSNAAVGVAPHSLRAVNGSLLDEVLRGPGSDGPIHIHIAEQVREVEDCVAWSGQRPVEWLYARQPVDSRWCLVHATHMSRAEAASVAASGAVVGLCPTTEANLGDGLFDAPGFLARGGRFGIGSDSNVSVSPVEELRWLEYGQRLANRARNMLSGGPSRSTGRTLLEQILAGGAQASGRRTGRIEAGSRADFIVLDVDRPGFHGRTGDAVLDTWIFAGNENRVRDVFVGGQAVIRDWAHPRERDIEARFRQALDQLAE